MFPAVGTVLAVGTLIVVFFTPWFELTTQSAPARWLLDAVLLGTGLLFVLPLMVDELLPKWATPGVRTLLAFVDGLADAIPGILVMTSGALLTPHFPGWALASLHTVEPGLDQRLGGGALLVVAESVGLPVIGAVFLEWVRSDERDAKRIDAAIDAVHDAPQATDHPAVTAPYPPGVGEGSETCEGSSLWWSQDPRYAPRRPPSD